MEAAMLSVTTASSPGRFRSSEGWSAGADASVAVLKVGANGNVGTGTATAQVNAFALTNGGWMACATVDGAKVTRLNTLSANAVVVNIHSLFRMLKASCAF
jgi:lipid-binding SYLF domain-containing protein